MCDDTQSTQSALPDLSDDVWEAFVQATTDREPRELLVESLRHTSEAGNALDLGCGAGNETTELLRLGWRVIAVDALAGAIDSTRAQAEQLGKQQDLTLVQSTFEELHLASASFDLIHAGFALPFVPPPSFEAFWEQLCRSLRPGGILAFQLFGDRDEWHTAENTAMSFHTLSEVQALLGGWSELHREEIEQDGQTALGDAKHWHVHHIIMRCSGQAH